ncbi:Aste57867_704 [Aphanomyces stellatus]|uniref:Aste57867_704 protein n=1 Tax=Aphanomyces stellatus TaxID=120398 RepID=A0A485K3L4_9STRA|nr:hypothetical protein As57867_000703 [Aphanomyces stellatus]VFT77928.1 Aste57867_704 [Aphanomyces stellatus]
MDERSNQVEGVLGCIGKKVDAGASFDAVWTVLPGGFASRLLCFLGREDQLHLIRTSQRIAADTRRDEMWELVGLERFRLASAPQGSWGDTCNRLYGAISETTALCEYVQGQNIFSLGYINRDIKERIQHQLLAMIDLTSTARNDLASRRHLAELNIVKHLTRLLSSNIMGICDLVCTALGNLICISSGASNQAEIDASDLRSQLCQSVESSRGDRMLKELLLSPHVPECGPGPTKHAARVLVNMVFPDEQLLCAIEDVWEGYIVAKASHPTLDDELCLKKHEKTTWRIMYRHCTGRVYANATVDMHLGVLGQLEGHGYTDKEVEMDLTGELHSRPGIHNCEFRATFINRGRPTDLPIAHIGFWSSLHPDKIWGVWEVGSSTDQYKLGSGGIFLMKAIPVKDD